MRNVHPSKSRGSAHAIAREASSLAAIVAFCACSAAPAAPQAQPRPTPSPRASSLIAKAPEAAPLLAVAYREPASAFEILDNLSLWSRGKCDEEYRTDWSSRFGITDEDERRFADYKALRKRYYDHGAQPEAKEVFGFPKPKDRVAEAFYAATTLDEAFATARSFMSAEDVAALASFFEAYRSRLAAIAAESAIYRDFAATLEERLRRPDATAFVRALAKAYGASELPTFTVLYVWWPPAEHIAANTRGRFLLLKYNPTKHREQASRDVDLPVHELTHYLSSHQPDARREALAKAFLAKCEPPKDLPPPVVLEEPLAVVHQKMFLRAIAPERFERASKWYGDRWTSELAKRLFDRVADHESKGGTIDEALMTFAGEECSSLAKDWAAR